MDAYTKLMTTITSKYDCDQVEQSENVISLYDLVAILDKEMEPLRKIKMEDGFRKKINADRTIFQRVGLFKKEAIINKKCEYVYTDASGDRSSITIGFGSVPKIVEVIELRKDFGSEEIYFSSFSKKDREFVNKYISDIYEIFGVLEEYGGLFPYENDKGRLNACQEFGDGLFDVSVSIDSFGRVTPTLVLCKGLGLEQIYAREWCSRESIATYVNNMQDDILKRIPIEISNLNESFKTLVERSKDKENTHKLIKK